MVYVDTLIDYGWKLGPSCHMIADTEDELHIIAQKIGLKRSWFQDHKYSMPHYDLVKSKRELAIKNGAIEIDRNKFSELYKRYHSEQKSNK